MTFAQRRNRLKTHFSERIPVVKRRMSVLAGWLHRNSSVSWGDQRYRTDRVDSHKSGRNQSISVTRQVEPSPLTSISNRVQINKLIRSNMHYASRISRGQKLASTWGIRSATTQVPAHHLVGRAAAVLRRVNPQDEALQSVDTLDLYRPTLTNNTNNRPSIINNTNIRCEHLILAQFIDFDNGEVASWPGGRAGFPFNNFTEDIPLG
jgi:hypothetical protein